MRIKFIVGHARVFPGLIGLCLFLAAVASAHAQLGLQLPPLPTDTGPQPKILDLYREKPSLTPTFTIPAGPLGFALPGEHYLLRRQSLVSLDFLDEDRILFTFRVSRLIQRETDDKSEDEKQQIQALVLSLPSGKIESRASWTVPDRSRYLWMLNDGHFLLRVPEGLDEGDAQLQLKPYLRSPGRLLWIEMDPREQVVITNSLEPATEAQKAGESGSSLMEPPTTAAGGQKPSEQLVLVARTQRRTTGEVIRVSRVPWTDQTADWPMNSEGYLENSQDGANRWLFKLNYFAGGGRALGHIESTCPPKYNFVSESELLLTTCDPYSGWKLSARLTNGDSLWEARVAANAVWPLLVMAPNGSRVAREALLLRRSVDHYKRMLDARDFEGQIVRVFDAAHGKIELEAPLTPILDGGGNVAFSPSGQRIAILNAGAIQSFNCPRRRHPDAAEEGATARHVARTFAPAEITKPGDDRRLKSNNCLQPESRTSSCASWRGPRIDMRGMRPRTMATSSQRCRRGHAWQSLNILSGSSALSSTVRKPYLKKKSGMRVKRHTDWTPCVSASSINAVRMRPPAPWPLASGFTTMERTSQRCGP